MARGFKIPKRRIGYWAQELIDTCSASRAERLQRGAAYRNLYLVGDESGDPATYPRSFAYIEDLSSRLYSPVELRFGLEHYGAVGPVTHAKALAGKAFLHRHVRRSSLDMQMTDAVTWSLVKGKTFIKQLWADNQIDPYMVQPEMMGVLNESVMTLDRQEAFCHTTYITPTMFERLIDGRDDQKELMKNAQRYAGPVKAGDDPANAGMLRQIVLGGLVPYQPQGSTRSSRGLVDWLGAPRPTLAPQLLSKLLRLDELWVWDSEREDWTTVQQIGPECVLEGKIQRRNIFADAVDTDYLRTSDNPLSGLHPFVEVCPQPVDGYFWGRSELANVALLQKMLNVRVNGINALLRRQEDPPMFGAGTTGLNQTALAKLKKPGGYLVDSNPNAKLSPVETTIPQGLYETINEVERWYAQMGGMTAAMSGQGEAGVRSQGHAETNVRMSSPRFKDRALLVERSVEESGGLALALLKAHSPLVQIAWVKEGVKTVEAVPLDPDLAEPPAPGMKPICFLMKHLDPDMRVTVDSHSASPAFAAETKQLMFDLNARGAVSPAQLIEATHPPNEDEALAAIQRAEIAKEQFYKEHPEAAIKAAGKGGKR